MFYTRSPLRNILEVVRNAIDEPFRVVYSRAEAQALGLRYPVTNEGVHLSQKSQCAMDRIHDRSRFSTPSIDSVARERVAPIDGTIAVDTAYTGTHGVNILYNRQINSVDRQTGLRPFAPEFGEVPSFRHGGVNDLPRRSGQPSRNACRAGSS